jgi:hypothetical protein
MKTIAALLLIYYMHTIYSLTVGSITQTDDYFHYFSHNTPKISHSSRIISLMEEYHHQNIQPYSLFYFSK